ncbi:phosphate acyltransferase, partial [Ancylobacter defluvii]|uniref:phosphate acyltransferase n=1 Tax=Ancylobacter defluvii TaxID=1282440 RepID=UPI0022F26D17
RETLMDPYKGAFAQKTDARSLAEVIAGADIFIGLSAGGVLKPEMLKAMADRPLIMALANPTPEIMPDLARDARPDAMICTGRSDFPNQVNNVLCFPFIFRGALDVAATTINEEMKIAAVHAIAELARETPSDVVARAYGGETPVFGATSLIPSPFDPRLILRVAPAVAKAAMDSGVAKRPIADFDVYAEELDRFVFRSGLVMKPVFATAKQAPKRVIYAEGEDERMLRAAQVVVEEGIARPILIGRPAVIDTRLERFGLSIRPGVDFDLINPEDDPRYRDYVQTYVELAGRRGVTPEIARTLVRTTPTVIAAVAVMRGDADTMLCGVEGRFIRHLRHIRTIIGLAPGVRDVSALSMLVTQKGAFFVCDTHVSTDPNAEDLVEMAIQAAGHVKRFGIEPRIAMVSHSDFGSRDDASAQKMRHATELLHQQAPELMVDGEMEGDSAIVPEIRERVLPGSKLQGVANILV